jgi:hypothetical protein
MLGGNKYLQRDIVQMSRSTSNINISNSPLQNVSVEDKYFSRLSFCIMLGTSESLGRTIHHP